MRYKNLNWKTEKIKDLSTYITVGFVGSMSSLFVEDGIPLLRGQNILPYQLNLTNLKYISLDTHKKWKKSALKPRDVAIVRVGYPGTACVIPDGIGELNAASLVIVRPNPELLDSHFLCYLLNSPWGKARIQSLLVGAAQQVFNTNTAAELEIPSPPLVVQQRIAEVLSAYDNLIENNQRRIKILEDMAQSLYREWFVHFRFPGHETVPLTSSPLGPIPQGWKVKKVTEVFEIMGGGTPSKKEPEFWDSGTINWYSPTDLTKAKNVFMDRSSDRITQTGLKRSSAKLFPPYSVMLTSRATIGVIAVNTTDACTNQGFITCLPNQRFPLWVLYHWLKENVETFIGLGTGATFKEITKGTFKEIPLIVPDKKSLLKYMQNAVPMMDQVLKLEKINRNLGATRDLLLPKLISGEIDLSGAVSELAVAA